jgi:hypothetical protein
MVLCFFAGVRVCLCVCVCVCVYARVYIYTYNIYITIFFRIAHLYTFINSIKKFFKMTDYKEYQGYSFFFFAKFILTLIKAAQEHRLR